MNWTHYWKDSEHWNLTVSWFVLVMLLSVGLGSLLSHIAKISVNPFPESSFTATYVASEAIYTPPSTGMPGRREGAGTR